MAATPYLLDTNILLRWVKPDDHDYPLVAAALDVVIKHGAMLCYASQNLAEFWNTCTRPVERNGYGLSPQQADFRARQFESNLRLLPESPEVHEYWRRLLVTHNVSGVQVHDARLVAIMRMYSVPRILTFNDRDFARYSDVQALSPKSLAGTTA